MGLAKALVMATAMVFAAPTPTSDPVAPVEQVVEVVQIKGRATWYDASRNNAWFTEKPRVNAADRNQDGAPYEFYAAAGPALRALKPFKWGKKPYQVIVENVRNGRAIIATVVDVCQCREGKNEKLIDLAPEAFLALVGDGGLGVGVMKVRVTILEGEK